eukprot:5892004-Pyramimonas_sp.AAC.1
MAFLGQARAAKSRQISGPQRADGVPEGGSSEGGIPARVQPPPAFRPVAAVRRCISEVLSECDPGCPFGRCIC